jgi:hypothetical protein
MTFEDQLIRAMRSSVDTLSPPVPDLVAGGRRRGQALRRRRQVGVAAVAACVVLAATGISVAVQRDGSTTGTELPAAGGCSSNVRTDVLPTWARDGFSDPEPRAPHVLSEDGAVVAILFGSALHAPPSAEVNNKILWVTREPLAGPLRIDAVREGTTTHVHRELAGAGPSIVDLPAPGCWRLDLRLTDYRGSIDLEYVRP